jgi:predicted metal-binding membrane protein
MMRPPCQSDPCHQQTSPGAKHVVDPGVLMGAWEDHCCHPLLLMLFVMGFVLLFVLFIVLLSSFESIDQLERNNEKKEIHEKSGYEKQNHE